MIDFKFHTDSGHGWLGVPAVMIKELNIKDKISKYSYLKNNVAYLEEDCDLMVFINAIKQKGLIENKDYFIYDDYKDNQPIRYYPRFNPSLI